MRCAIYDDQTLKTLHYERLIPECGEDFCDRCGDCLSCYEGDDCRDGGSHIWVMPESEWQERKDTMEREASGE